jgi:hypothetical protein
VPPDKIKEFCNEILKAGMHLASVSKMDFPNADSVSNGIACVLRVVEQHKLIGKWVTSRANNTGEYMTTRKIHKMSIFAFSVLLMQCAISNYQLFFRLLCRLLSIVW